MNRNETIFEASHEKKKRPLLVRDILNYAVGEHVTDPFFDCGCDELLTAHAIIDLIGLHEPKYITVKFDKAYLKRILHSHIVYIRGIDAHRAV